MTKAIGSDGFSGILCAIWFHGMSTHFFPAGHCGAIKYPSIPFCFM